MCTYTSYLWESSWYVQNRRGVPTWCCKLQWTVNMVGHKPGYAPRLLFTSPNKSRILDIISYIIVSYIIVSYIIFRISYIISYHICIVYIIYILYIYIPSVYINISHISQSFLPLFSAMPREQTKVNSIKPWRCSSLKKMSTFDRFR